MYINAWEPARTYMPTHANAHTQVSRYYTPMHTPKIMTSPKANRDYGYLPVFQYFLNLSFENNHVLLCCENASLGRHEVNAVCA